MKMCSRFFVPALLIFTCSCSLEDENPGISVYSASFDFNQSLDGWEADFTDLPSNADDSSFYELTFAYTDLPTNLGSKKSLMLSGINHSDDLFMFIKRKISGLIPNTSYNIVFEVELASNAQRGAVGIGGSPGESVFLKAGASEREPRKVAENNQYILNIDKGNQSTDGDDVITIGDIAIPSNATQYTLITRTNASPYTSPYNQTFFAQSNSAGEIWLIIGTDSGFEGTTTVYYTKVNVVFSASN
jgi:hypothetical protein